MLFRNSLAANKGNSMAVSISSLHLVVRRWSSASQAKKKADVVERPQAFDHVGLLVNEPSGSAGFPPPSHPTMSIESLSEPA